MSVGADRPPATRLAPSPTGALHLGNARTFLINWLLARRNGWRIVLRIDDLDGPRVKAGADQAAIRDLHWLGLDWDEGPTYQSKHAVAHRDAVDRLLSSGDAYPCVCTRTEIERAASAPHAEDGAAVYPGTCRGRFGSVAEARTFAGREPAIRFRVDDERIVRWHDAFAGAQATPLGSLGDFVVRKSDGTAAYQLATVVNDAAAGVTAIVRGDDLLDSTPRQMLIYEALRLQPIDSYIHLPLVVGPDGRRLAKRHGDTRLSTYRDAGTSAETILRLLAQWSGIALARDEPVSTKMLLDRFDLKRVPTAPIVMREADDPMHRAPRAT